MANPVMVEVTRGDLVESVHRGAIAIADSTGAIVAQWGDIQQPVFPRSAIKMIQALPLVDSGAADAFQLSDETLSLACASHSGELMHTERVAHWLAAIEASEGDLACGPHAPQHDGTRDALMLSGHTPCRLHNNCSGKHSGFLTLARHLRVPLTGYVDPAHPVQLAVMDAISATAGVPVGFWAMGVDGCSAPNFALPLASWATAMARMATGLGLSPDRARAAQRLIAAMRNHPEIMSGTGRACAALMRQSTGRVTVKTGAEGVFVAILPDRGLGVALKVDDGATRAAETLMATCLVMLGQLDPDAISTRGFIAAPVKNWNGEEVGLRRPVAGFLDISL